MVYETEVQAMREIIRIMRETGTENRLLVNTERIYLAKTNLIILKAMLEELGKKGVFIAIDRPYHYMVHLMKIHRFHYDEMLFIDAITKISGERRMEWSSASFLNGPFSIDTLLRDLKIITKDPAGRSQLVDLTDGDFLMIDDVSAIFHYNKLGTGRRFLKTYLDIVGNKKSTFTAVSVDRESHTSLYEFLAQNCDRMVDMGNAAFMVVPRSSAEATEAAKAVEASQKYHDGV